MQTDFLPIPEQISILQRGCVDVISAPELETKLKTLKPLRVKAGFDPTAPDLHLGHFVLLRKLRHFQDLGHHVQFLMGDFTGMIGDPTGKSETRKTLTREEVLVNSQTYKDQVFKVLIPDKTTILFNSEWCSPMNFEQVLVLASKYSVARILERDDFSKRYKAGSPISLLEFMYPLIQGYDSVAMKCDVEIGGTDQKFNLLVGRDLQRDYGQSPQIVMTLPLLVGLDGVKKMSKSLGNYVGITDTPIDMYGKLMSIPDEILWNYLELLTDLPLSEIEKRKKAIAEGGLHPKEAKTEMAKLVMNQLHPKDENETAIAEWNKIHDPKNRQIPTDIPTTTVDASFFEGGNPLLVQVLGKIGFTTSIAEARRLIQGGGLYLNEEKIASDTITLEKNQEYLIRQGKKGKFIKLLT